MATNQSSKNNHSYFTLSNYIIRLSYFFYNYLCKSNRYFYFHLSTRQPFSPSSIIAVRNCICNYLDVAVVDVKLEIMLPLGCPSLFVKVLKRRIVIHAQKVRNTVADLDLPLPERDHAMHDAGQLAARPW